jgi:transposase
MGKRCGKESKTEAVRPASEPGSTQAGIEWYLGIGQGLISRWKREFGKDSAAAFPGKGRRKPENEKLRRLERKNERLCGERDILKKAAAIFPENPSRYSDSWTCASIAA